MEKTIGVAPCSNPFDTLSVRGRSRCFSISRLLGFDSLCVNLQTPRYRPWITASSLLRLSGDVVDGETAAQGYLCKSGCQVEHISRERSRVKPQSGKNLPEINKLLIKWQLSVRLARRPQAELHILPGTTATQYSRNFSPQRSQIRCFTWVVW